MDKMSNSINNKIFLFPFKRKETFNKGVRMMNCCKFNVIFLYTQWWSKSENIGREPKILSKIKNFSDSDSSFSEILCYLEFLLCFVITIIKSTLGILGTEIKHVNPISNMKRKLGAWFKKNYFPSALSHWSQYVY